MSVSERCSCGSSFKTDEPNAAKLLREWRRKHVCVHRFAEPDNAISGTAQVEHAIGFRMNGLVADLPNVEPDWE